MKSDSDPPSLRTSRPSRPRESGTAQHSTCGGQQQQQHGSPRPYRRRRARSHLPTYLPCRPQPRMLAAWCLMRTCRVPMMMCKQRPGTRVWMCTRHEMRCVRYLGPRYIHTPAMNIEKLLPVLRIPRRYLLGASGSKPTRASMYGMRESGGRVEFSRSCIWTDEISILHARPAAAAAAAGK